jgi:cell division septal protein FtsQ
MKTIKRRKGQRTRIAITTPGVDKRFVPLHQNFEGNRGAPTAKKLSRPAKSTTTSRVAPSSRSHLPAPKPKKRSKHRPKHAPINWRAIEKRCWLLLGSVLTLSIWLSPVTQPANLQLRGVPAEGQAELKSLLESRWHTPFAVNTGYGTLQRTLTQVAWIQNAQITPKMDGNLSGIVVPRTAVAKVMTPDKVFWLDENGYAFIPPNPKEHRQVKTIRMDYSPAALYGTPVEEEPLQRVLVCLQKIKTQNLFQKVVFDINLAREICLNISGLSTGHVLQVRLGDASDVVEQFEVMKQLFRQKPQLLAQCEYLDLQCPTAPAIKRRDAGLRDLDSNVGGKKP